MYWAVNDPFDPQIKSAYLNGSGVVTIVSDRRFVSRPGNRDMLLSLIVCECLVHISCVKLDTYFVLVLCITQPLIVYNLTHISRHFLLLSNNH